MLGTVARPLVRVSRNATRRSFVSTVLLTKSYENEPVSKLKQELKARGLSQSGNKAALISRIQEHDKTSTLEAISSRKASTAPTPISPSTPAPAVTPISPVTESVTPGIPPAEQPTSLFPPEFLNVHIPNTYQPPKTRLAKIPFVPDLWDSSSKQTVETPEPDSQEPKIVLMAGAGTHPDGGPAHNTVEYTEVPEEALPKQSSTPSLSTQKDGFLSDLIGDVKFLPDSSTQEPQPSRSHRSRPLNDEERKGLWILFGLIGGSWAGGYYFVHD